MILILDNYDSFTYNLVQLIGQHTKHFKVFRNDALSIEEVDEIKPDGIIISPGPGRPENAGICVDLIVKLGKKYPILGVCLGHQVIGYAFGCKINNAPQLMHGKTSPIYHQGIGIYRNLPNPFEAARYHSLVISHTNLPAELLITSRTDDNIIMGIKHKEYPIEGIQFHPESILTTVGSQILTNWFNTLSNTKGEKIT